MFTSLLALALLIAPTDTTAVPAPGSAAALLSAVHGYMAPLNGPSEDVEIRTEWVDVSGDGTADALVYLEGATWCGSGGCTVLVFEAITDSVEAAELGAFRVAAEISLMHGPVVVVLAGPNAWADLVVRNAGGQSVALQFDGETYPSSPADGVAVSAATAGVTLFATTK